jgi:hypothetical protein
MKTVNLIKNKAGLFSDLSSYFGKLRLKNQIFKNVIGSLNCDKATKYGLFKRGLYGLDIFYIFHTL